jgi:hypothetical protein
MVQVMNFLRVLVRIIRAQAGVAVLIVSGLAVVAGAVLFMLQYMCITNKELDILLLL